MSTTEPARTPTPTGDDHRAQLLEGIPVTERRLELAGIDTTVLEGGDGPPVVLLHGPGESAVKWYRILPELSQTHSVVAPDLPAQGETEVPDDGVDLDRVLDWLDELIDRTTTTPPALVGQVLGGAIAARYAIRHGDRISALVLQDSLGLGPFRPAPRFAFRMLRFLRRPSERRFERFMDVCSHDVEALRHEMGERWGPFVAYNVDGARGPGAKVVGRMMRQFGTKRIPDEDLDRIEVPTTLVWGRQDLAIRLGVAERASERHGWPLRVIEDCADDPPRDRPREFLDALLPALAPTDEAADGESPS